MILGYKHFNFNHSDYSDGKSFTVAYIKIELKIISFNSQVFLKKN